MRKGFFLFVNELIPKLFSEKNAKELTNQVDFVKGIGYKTSDFGAIGALEQ